jgi:hypothetical protein
MGFQSYIYVQLRIYMHLHVQKGMNFQLHTYVHTYMQLHVQKMHGFPIEVSATGAW